MMKNRQFIAALAVLMLALTVGTAFLADDSDAESMAGLDGNITYSDFKEKSSGTLHVTVANYNTEAIEVTVEAVDADNVATVYGTATITIAAGEKGTADLSFGLSAGTHTVKVICTPTDYFAAGQNSATVTIEVPASIWSGWVPYVTIVIVVIIIIGGAYYYMRNRIKEKPDTTFTQLAAEKNSKKDGKEAPAEEKRSATARRRYDSATDTKAEAKPAEEKPQKPASFTEMHEKEQAAKTEKTEKPEAKPAEEKSQKLKYVSSRRK